MIAQPPIIHVTTPDAWRAGRDTPFYAPASLESEGFIHACRPEQLRGVLGRHFAGHRALVLLVVDPARLTSEVREEEAVGETFPHVYGPIDRAAVLSALPIEADASGVFAIPEAAWRSTGPNPLLVVVSGPSGVGKDAVLARLREMRPDLFFAVTATTRPMREGETDGVDYIFLSPERFGELLDSDEFLEHAEVYGNRYGVPKAPVRRALAEGFDAFVKIDIQGAATIRAMASDALLVFIAPPSMEELERRLRERMTESPEQLRTRMETASREMEAAKWFDAVIVNDTDALDNTVEFILTVVEHQRNRVPPRTVTI